MIASKNQPKSETPYFVKFDRYSDNNIPTYKRWLLHYYYKIDHACS